MDSPARRLVVETEAEAALLKLQTELHESRAVEREVLNELLVAQAANQRLTQENGKLQERLRKQESIPKAFEGEIHELTEKCNLLESELRESRAAADRLRQENQILQQKYRDAVADLSSARRDADGALRTLAEQQGSFVPSEEIQRVRESALEQAMRVQSAHEAEVRQLKTELEGLHSMHARELAALKSLSAANLAQQADEHERTMRRLEMHISGLQQSQQAWERERSDRDKEMQALKQTHAAQITALEASYESRLVQLRAECDDEIRNTRIECSHEAAALRVALEEERVSHQRALAASHESWMLEMEQQQERAYNERILAAVSASDHAAEEAKRIAAEMERHLESERSEWRKTEELMNVRITQLTDSNQQVRYVGSDGAALCLLFTRMSC